MTLRRFVPLVSLLLLLAVPASAQAGGRVASATGVKKVNGEKLYVDVLVALPSGKSAREATDKALSQQGARRVKPPWAGGPGGPGGGGGGGEQFFYTGLVWDPASATQNYNPADEPLDARALLQNTESTWSSVNGSSFDLTYGSDTSRCPSLVKECRGRQSNDQNNDVGWFRLSGSTLGVTWYDTRDPEADMALNNRFPWTATCSDTGSGYDVETVYLHENGHVAGLDHTDNTDSVMYPSYLGAQCSLDDYDKAALANLYPS